MAPASSTAQARRRARALALQGLYQWQLSATAPALIYEQFQLEQPVAGADLDYFHELLTCVPERAAALDAQFAAALDRPLAQLDPIELTILRLAVYELQVRTDVPFRVVISEAIELAKRFGGEQGHRYINAVLDRVAPRMRPEEYAEHGRRRG